MPAVCPAGDVEAKAGSVLNREVVWVPVTLEQLRRLSRGSLIEGRIGKHEVKFNGRLRKDLAALALLVPGLMDDASEVAP